MWLILLSYKTLTPRRLTGSFIESCKQDSRRVIKLLTLSQSRRTADLVSDSGSVDFHIYASLPKRSIVFLFLSFLGGLICVSPKRGKKKTKEGDLMRMTPVTSNTKTLLLPCDFSLAYFAWGAPLTHKSGPLTGIRQKPQWVQLESSRGSLELYIPFRLRMDLMQ